MAREIPTPIAALDARLDLLKAVTSDRTRWEILAFTYFFGGEDPDTLNRIIVEGDAADYQTWMKARMRAIPRTEHDRLKHDVEWRLKTAAWNLERATTYWAAPEMTELLAHAARTFPPQPLRSDHLPAPCGFLVLPQPIDCAEAGGRKLIVQVLAWTDIHWLVKRIGGTSPDTATPGVVLTPFVPTGTNIGFGGVGGWEPSLQHWRIFWPYGSEWGEREATAERSESETATSIALSRLAATFWTLVDQEITADEEARPDRAAARRIQRQLPEDPATVRVVTLRRRREETPKDPGSADANYSHRFIVDGHWRNQPWGPKHSLRRHQWIGAYTKGPEDKPLVVKDKVYAWRR